MAKSDPVRITIVLTAALVEALQARAEAEMTSVSYLMRQAARAYLGTSFPHAAAFEPPLTSDGQEVER